MAVVEKPLTLDEFLALPEEEPPLEYADGVVTRKVPPKTRHSALQLDLAKRIDQIGLPNKVARAFTELRTTFGGASRVPDVAVFRWDRIPRDASGRLADDVFEPPDIAIEMASPGQSVNSLVRRCLWYGANGVHVALLVDPEDESVLAFRPGGGVTALQGADRIDLTEILPEFELTVDELFAALR